MRGQVRDGVRETESEREIERVAEIWRDIT